MLMYKLIPRLFFAISCFSSACSKPKDETKLDDLTATTSTQLAQVESHMIPGSLVTTNPSQNLSGEGPCAGTEGFFDCQPNLLKLYLGMGKSMVTMSKQLVAAVGPSLSQLPAPSSGTVSQTAGDGNIQSIDYHVSSASEFSILLHTALGPLLELDVAGNIYTIRGDTSKSADGGAAKLSAVITYNDENNFTVDLKLVGMECKADDIRAPQNIAIKIQVKDGVWQGKSMLYLPRWLVAEGTTCSFEPNDTSRMFFYSDFVGDDSQSTISIYFIPPTVTSSEQFADYPASEFCTNFAHSCMGTYGFGDPNPVSSYKNPACVSAAGTSSWGAPCVSTQTPISTPTYSSSSEWLLPLDMERLTVDVPETL